MSRTTARRNYYAVLQVPPWADLATITKAYRQLALKKHPDRNKHRNATAEFQLLGEAYETLRDVDKRRQYDRTHFRTDLPETKKRRESRNRNSTESLARIRAELKRLRRVLELYVELERIRHDIEIIFRNNEKELLRHRIIILELHEKLPRPSGKAESKSAERKDVEETWWQYIC